MKNIEIFLFNINDFENNKNFKFGNISTQLFFLIYCLLIFFSHCEFPQGTTNKWSL